MVSKTFFSDQSIDFTFESIVLSADQVVVFEKIVDWLSNVPSKNLTIGGYAGTGKTTLIALLRMKLFQANQKNAIGFASFTGKAAENLRKKLVTAHAIFSNDSCGTIHRLMYKAKLDGKGELVGWEKNSSIDKDLIIIDEASMITSEVWTDLLSYGIPIIAFGDHGQLPPIGDSFNLMEKPDFTLEKIHRQSQENPIIELATQARLGQKIAVKNYSEKVRKIAKNSQDSEDFCQSFFEKYDDDSLVLVGMNSSRVRLNQEIRLAKNILSQTPVVGDKVVCLKNIYTSNSSDIYNGMTGIIKDIYEHGAHWYRVTIEFEQEEKVYEGNISKYQFNNPTLLRSVKGLPSKEIGDLFDYGYALTVHKAQGSEASRVLVIDESYVFGREDITQAHKWLYTAVTRAVDELCVIGW